MEPGGLGLLLGGGPLGAPEPLPFVIALDLGVEDGFAVAGAEAAQVDPVEDAGPAAREHALVVEGLAAGVDVAAETVAHAQEHFDGLARYAVGSGAGGYEVCDFVFDRLVRRTAGGELGEELFEGVLRVAEGDAAEALAPAGPVVY